MRLAASIFNVDAEIGAEDHFVRMKRREITGIIIRRKLAHREGRGRKRDDDFLPAQVRTKRS